MIPGDRAVVCGLEWRQQVGRREAVGLVAGGSRIVDLYRRDVFAHGVIDAPDQAAVVGNSHRAREKTFGDAVRHVDPRRLAPFRDHVAAANDQAGGVAAILDRPDRIAERLAAEGLVMIELEIAWRLGLAGDCKIDRVFERLLIHADVGGLPVLPDRVRVIGRFPLPRLAGLRLYLHRICEEKQRKQSNAAAAHDGPAPDTTWTDIADFRVTPRAPYEEQAQPNAIRT